MKKNIVSILSALAGIGLFVAAAVVLHNQLRAFHYHDIVHAVQNHSAIAIGLAILFTVLNYAVLSLYEVLGFRYIKKPLPWRKIAFTSFVSFAFSNNVGLYTLSGSAVRFRFYSQWGISSFDISRLIAFSSVTTFWLGLCAVCGLVFTVYPLALPAVVHLPFATTRFPGILFLCVVAAALSVAACKKEPFRFRSWEFAIPDFKLVVGLIATACFDWVLAAAVLFVLLPHGSVTFPALLGIFLAAQIIGLISHVPGGLGVFESMVLLMLPSLPSAAVFGSLIAFRVIYYLIPLIVSAVIIAAYEFRLHTRNITQAASRMGVWTAGIIPYVFSLLTFIAGTILLFSGATPAVHHRVILIAHIIPLPLVEFSHFAGSIIGVILLLLSWGLMKRLDAAFHMTLYMLAGGIVFSMLKGLDYEEAIIMAGLVGLLIPCKGAFYRKTSFVDDRFTPGWMAAIGIILISTFWLGLFSFKHVVYTHDLWWQFGFFEHASRFLRAMVGIAITVLSFAVIKLWSPSKRHSTAADYPADFDRVRMLVQNSPRSAHWIALLGDKKFFFSENKDAFIMYAVKGRTWVAMGDPVGAEPSFSRLVWDFHEECDRHNGRLVFHEVGSEYLPLYLDIGMTLLKIGEEALVNLPSFSLDGGSKKSLRRTARKLGEEGYSFEIIPVGSVAGILPELKSISDDWLMTKNTREKSFSLGSFNEAYLLETPIAVVRSAEGIVAFANMWTPANKQEMSVDLMRYSHMAPPGIMDYLFVCMMQWGGTQGYTFFNLGMAPFGGMEQRPVAPLWNRMGAFLYRHGENFYNFQGLRHYKEKFDPVWKPKYLATPGGLFLPVVLKDVSALISGGIKGVFTK